jgi:hypothetical protein
MLSVDLRRTQHELGELAINRSSDPFDNLIGGKSGAGMFYDTFRRLRSVFSRKTFRTNHGEQFE